MGGIVSGFVLEHVRSVKLLKQGGDACLHLLFRPARTVPGLPRASELEEATGMTKPIE